MGKTLEIFGGRGILSTMKSNELSDLRFPHIPRLICPCCCWSGVRITRMPTRVSARRKYFRRPRISTHGAMITLAPGTGSSLRLCPSDRGPMHVTGVGTAERYRSSSESSCDADFVYHDPAWLASRTILPPDMTYRWNMNGGGIRCSFDIAVLSKL